MEKKEEIILLVAVQLPYSLLLAARRAGPAGLPLVPGAGGGGGRGSSAAGAGARGGPRQSWSFSDVLELRVGDIGARRLHRGSRLGPVLHIYPAPHLRPLE